MKNPCSGPPLCLRHIHLRDDLARLCIRCKTLVARAFRQLSQREQTKLQVRHSGNPPCRATWHDLEYLVCRLLLEKKNNTISRGETLTIRTAAVLKLNDLRPG